MEARIRKLEHLLNTAEVASGRRHRARSRSGASSPWSITTATSSTALSPPRRTRSAGMLLASPTSPLGGALLGASVGDEVSYEAPGGDLQGHDQGGSTLRGLIGVSLTPVSVRGVAGETPTQKSPSTCKSPDHRGAPRSRGSRRLPRLSTRRMGGSRRRSPWRCRRRPRAARRAGRC